MGIVDHERFEALTLPLLGDVYRLAVKLAGHPRDAEDLVQETYVKALAAFPGLRNPEQVKSWLFQILSRVVIDRHRAGSHELPVGSLAELDRFSLFDVISDEDPLPYSDRLHADFMAQFPDEAVRTAIQKLPEIYRVPLVIYYVEELSYQQLAELLGCPVGTVMSRLYRGRKLLERELWECAKERGLIRTWQR